ncbi:RNA polymerase sigma factor [Halobacillus litoralis]|uniref:RNA polymerase sigma factor n=1 Tax=Halobacillus litoralis TaxID=45668 RepID=UPI00353217D2
MDFCEMYEQYYHRVYYTALKVTKNPCSAEDILQETFIKAYDKLEGIREEGKVGAWLSTIAHRKAIDLLRVIKKRGPFFCQLKRFRYLNLSMKMRILMLSTFVNAVI